MAKKKLSEGENTEEVTQAEIVEYAERALDTKDVSYGEVPLCREYFFNQELVESDLSNICGAKDKEKSKIEEDPDPSELGYPWADVTFDGRKKSFSSWKGQTWCVGDDIDGDIYVTAAAGQYGIIEPGKTLPITRARQTLEILKRVAEGASREDIEEAIEIARLGKRKKTAVDSVAEDTKEKAKEATKVPDEESDSESESSATETETDLPVEDAKELKNWKKKYKKLKKKVRKAAKAAKENTEAQRQSVAVPPGTVIPTPDPTARVTSPVARTKKETGPKSWSPSSSQKPKKKKDHLRDLAWKNPSETHGGNLMNRMAERRGTVHSVFQAIRNEDSTAPTAPEAPKPVTPKPAESPTKMPAEAKKPEKKEKQKETHTSGTDVD